MILQIEPDPFAANICRTWAQRSEYRGRLPSAGLWWGMERIFSDGGTLVGYEVKWLKQGIRLKKRGYYDELEMEPAQSDDGLVSWLLRSIDEADYVYSKITDAPDIEELE